MFRFHALGVGSGSAFVAEVGDAADPEAVLINGGTAKTSRLVRSFIEDRYSELAVVGATFDEELRAGALSALVSSGERRAWPIRVRQAVGEFLPEELKEAADGSSQLGLSAEFRGNPGRFWKLVAFEEHGLRSRSYSVQCDGQLVHIAAHSNLPLISRQLSSHAQSLDLAALVFTHRKPDAGDFNELALDPDLHTWLPQHVVFAGDRHDEGLIVHVIEAAADCNQEVTLHFTWPAKGLEQWVREKAQDYGNVRFEFTDAATPHITLRVSNPAVRAVVHCMHEHEFAQVARGLPNTVICHMQVIAEPTLSDVEALRRKGLIVEVVGEAQEKVPLSDELSRLMEPEEVEQDGMLMQVARAPMRFDLRLSRALTEGDRDELEALGDVRLEAMGPRWVSLTVAPALLPKVLAQGAVLEVQRSEPLFGAFDEAELVDAKLANERDMQDVLFADDKARVDAEQWLSTMGMRGHPAKVLESAERKLRVETTPSMLRELWERYPGMIVAARRYRDPVLMNSVCCKLMGTVPSKNAPHHGLTGKGQIVAVADTGIDETHEDLKPRIKKVIARAGNTVDRNGHGTHVAGSIVGLGTRSDGRVRGVASGAELVMQCLSGAANGEELKGLPLRLDELLREAYAEGARIHNNSWGVGTAGSYTTGDVELDEFIALHPDMLVVVAAGNGGRATNNRISAKGEIDEETVGSPATSKNSLVVGASQSKRKEGGRAGRQYGEYWTPEFQGTRFAKLLLSGDPNQLAPFSARGGCQDGRIRPDVVAPGTDVFSTKSSAAPAHNFWGTDEDLPDYAYLGGTSMAAPLVSGVAALVREYYVDRRQHAPSAALLKATIINGAEWLKHEDARVGRKQPPNNHQGFGRVNMKTTVPPPGASWRLAFLDDWKGGQGLRARGQELRFQVEVVAPGEPLRVTLAYTDPPAVHIQNNLNLKVEFAEPGGPVKKWLGNLLLAPSGEYRPDNHNNVESITLSNAKPGVYGIYVTAGGIIKPPQDFALVVTGALRSDDVRPGYSG